MRHCGISRQSLIAALRQWESAWGVVRAEAKGPGFSYSTVQYWDRFYSKKAKSRGGEPQEWYVELKNSDIAGVLGHISTIPKRALHVGCGFSMLGANLAMESADWHVDNVDASDVVIEEMRKRALELLTDEQLQRCTWKHWDLAADPELEAGAGYDVVLDKGFFCASLFGGTAHAADCLWACVSALRPGGVLIQVDEDPPEQRLELLRKALPKEFGWQISSHSIEQDDDSSHFEYFIYRAQHVVGTLNSACTVVDLGEGSRGLVAARDLAAGEVAIEERASCKRGEPNRYTVQSRPDCHLEFSADIRFANHSFSPTCTARLSEEDDLLFRLVAIEDIPEGSPITYDYLSTETKLSHPFTDGETGLLVSGQ